MEDINAWLIHCGVTPFAPFVNLGALMEFTIEQLKFRLESADAAIMVFNRLRRLQRQEQAAGWPRDEPLAADTAGSGALSAPLRDVPPRMLSSPPMDRRQASPFPSRMALTSNPRTMSPTRDTSGRPGLSPQPSAPGWCLLQSTAAPRGGQFAESGGPHQNTGAARNVPVWAGGQPVPSSALQWHASWQHQGSPTNRPPSQWSTQFSANPGHHPGLHGWRHVPEQATRADGFRPRCVGPVRSPQRAVSP
mmetsp:Transcript_49965/g.131688  ORF Transcript_49965/g.131688 Transcript_49965/m.131688 type:complete len:249 (+) Transcript_49965:395-1141(+)